MVSIAVQNTDYLKLSIIFLLISLLVGAIGIALAQYKTIRGFIASLRSIGSPLAFSFLRIVLGIMILSGAFTHVVFGPEISSDQIPMILSLEPILFTLGLCFILNIAIPLTSFVTLLIFLETVWVKGALMMTYLGYASVLAIYISKYIFNISNNTKIFILRIGMGVAVLYTIMSHPLPSFGSYTIFFNYLLHIYAGVSLIIGMFVPIAALLVISMYAASLTHMVPIAICLVIIFNYRPSYAVDVYIVRFMKWLLKIKEPRPLKTVIIGGGFGGISAALELVRLSPDHADITLVSDTEYHALHPAFYEAATYEQPQRSVAIPLSTIFHEKPVTLKIGKVLKIKTDEHIIELQNNERLHYEKLIFAAGSESNDFHTPGVKEYGIPLKTLDEAMRIQTKVRTLFETACNEEQCRPIHIVIGGGGFTGVELAGEMAKYTRKLACQFCVPQELVHVHLVHSQPHILSGLDETIGLHAQARLSSIGVDLILGSRIASVSDSAITLKDSRVIPCSLLIWTAGVKGNSLARSTGLEIDKDDHIYVNSFLQPNGHPEIYVCGDAAAYRLPESSVENPQYAPGVAQVAKEQGKNIGRNIFNEMVGEKLEPYRYRHMGYVIPVDGKYAYAHLKYLTFEGIFAYILQQLIILQWLLVILPLPAALLRFDTFEMELMSED